MKYIYAVCFLLLVCSCHKENDTPVVLPARTLLVYLGGDNNLDAETYDKLVQIKNGWEDGTDMSRLITVPIFTPCSSATWLYDLPSIAASMKTCLRSGESRFKAAMISSGA